MKLISMTDFVLQRAKKSILPLNVIETFKEGGKITNEIFNYANFLKQPLKLEMFVPCDEEGNVLEEPDKEFELSYWDCSTKISKYQQAKEKVLFEGFRVSKAKLFINSEKTIEDLIKYDLTLTPNATKQILI